jgi:hypothetical protein
MRSGKGREAGFLPKYCVNAPWGGMPQEEEGCVLGALCFSSSDESGSLRRQPPSKPTRTDSVSKDTPPGSSQDSPPNSTEGITYQVRPKHVYVF